MGLRPIWAFSKVDKSLHPDVYILTAICIFSKYIVLVPLRDKKAITIASAIYERVEILRILKY